MGWPLTVRPANTLVIGAAEAAAGTTKSAVITATSTHRLIPGGR
jgi:hypothetical protein